MNDYPDTGDHHPAGSEVLAEIGDQRLAAEAGDVLLRADLRQPQGIVTERSLQYKHYIISYNKHIYVYIYTKHISGFK